MGCFVERLELGGGRWGVGRFFGVGLNGKGLGREGKGRGDLIDGVAREGGLIGRDGWSGVVLSCRLGQLR